MKTTISFLFIGLLSLSCARPDKATVTMTGCKQATDEYFSVSHQVKPIGNVSPTPMPPMKIIGVSLIKKVTDDYLALQVEAESSNGEQVSFETVCQEFTGDGKRYWKIIH